jgi:hypothetical protein
MKHTRDADPDIAPEYDFAKGRRAVHLKQARRGIKRDVATSEPSLQGEDADSVARRSDKPGHR